MENQITISLISVELIALITIIVVGFLLILNALKTDEIDVLNQKLTKDKELREQFIKQYNKQHHAKYMKLLDENLKLKSMPNSPTKVKKKDLNTAINEMNKHASHKDENGKLGK